VLDPQIQALLDAMNALPGPPGHEVPVAQARAAHAAETEEMSGPGEAVASVRDIAVPSSGGGDEASVSGDEAAGRGGGLGRGGGVPVRVYRPAAGGADGAAPGVVAYFHGGGWCLGTIDSFDTVCRALANASGALVASVGYRLAPEHPFPAAVEDARTVVRWLGEHAAELGGDPGRLAVAGDSAGGNLAAVTARRLRDDGGPPLRLQALVYPACDAGLNTPSYRETGDGYGLTAASMRRWWELYLDGADGLQPDCSPLRAADLAGLPPAFVLTVDRDVLRDEGEAYAAALERAGVPVTHRRYDGAVHGFFRWLAKADLSRRAVDEVAGALAGALKP
jgi:acetyl esterase